VQYAGACFGGPKMCLVAHWERKMNLSLIGMKKKKALWRRKPVGTGFNQDKILLLLGKTTRFQDFIQRQTLFTKHGKPSSCFYLHFRRKA